MATFCSTVFTKFYDLIEEDEKFFDGFGLSAEEQQALIDERADGLMHEAMSYLRRHCELEITLDAAVIEGVYQFVEELTEDEVILLALVMKYCYYEHKVSNLDPKVNALSASEMKYAYSPNQERTTYLALVDRTQGQIDVEISHYLASNRIDGKRKIIEYSLPVESDDEDV